MQKAILYGCGRCFLSNRAENTLLEVLFTEEMKAEHTRNAPWGDGLI